MKEKSRKLMWIATGILMLIFILVIYMTNSEIPFMMDDNWYSTMLAEDRPIETFADIVKSQIWHYYNWGGRSITHGILQLTLLAGERAADILNVLFTLLLGGMICLVSEHRRLPGLLAGISMVLGLNANWKMSMFWQAGAANYLYITVFILAFLYCYLRELPDEGKLIPCFFRRGLQKEGSAAAVLPEAVCAGETESRCGPRHLPGISIWIIPLGILTGWSNENMGPAVWIVSLAVILLILKEKGRIRLWMISGNLACLAGSILCITAPGNAVRMARIKEEEYGILWRIFLRGYGESKGVMEYLFPVLLVLGFVWILNCCVLKQLPGRRTELMLFCALLSWGAFVLSPHYPDRASFGTLVLCVCAVLSIVAKILKRRADLAWPFWFAMLFCWLRGMYFCGEYLSLAWGWIK
nr:DUF6056 family protein [uncultured Acetatifactor sp.]